VLVLVSFAVAWACFFLVRLFLGINKCTLFQFIALQTSLPAEEVEILAGKGLSCTSSSVAPVQHQVSSCAVFDAFKDDLQVLHSEETLAGLKAACSFSQGRLVSFYTI